MSKKLLIDVIKDFYPYAKKNLGFDKNAKIFLKGDQENAKNILGKTGYYDPTRMEIVVFTTNRHPKDILRSIAHELVHHMQNCRGDLGKEEAGENYAQNNPHLRKMEAEAYEKGNLIFRDFEDNLKTKNKILHEALQKLPKVNIMTEEKQNDDQVNPLTKEKANDHYVKRAERVFRELTERWKMKPKEDKKEEDKDNEKV